MEVFIQDWKSYEGWSQLTKQPGEEGARHSVILSLLVDHSLFVHPYNTPRNLDQPVRW